MRKRRSMIGLVILLVLLFVGWRLLISPRRIDLRPGAVATTVGLTSGQREVAVVMTYGRGRSGRVEAEILVDDLPRGHIETRFDYTGAGDVSPFTYYYFWFDWNLWPDLVLVPSSSIVERYIVESGSGRLVRMILVPDRP